MRIVQINCSASGSTGNIAKAIKRHLEAKGHTGYIFYEGGIATEKKMFRIGNYFSLHLHSVLSRNLGKQGYFSLLPTLRMIRRIKKIKPDVVHLHNLHGSYLHLPVLFRYLKESKTMVTVTLHDCWLFTGKCPHFTVVGCNKWKEECGKCPQLHVYPKSKIDTTKQCLRDKKQWLSGFENRMRVVAVSDWLKSVAKTSFLAQYPIQTIYNGIDCNVFCPREGSAVRAKYRLDNKFVILGVSANWNEQKGLGEFLQLAEHLSEDEVIVLVGLTQAQLAGMPPQIIGIERTEDKDELAALYSAADVFVSTSKEESFGLVTIEAMACGTPVIVYNSTACAEAVDETSGFVMQGDHTLQDCVRLAREEKKIPTKVFSEKEMVEQYLKLYLEMLDDEETAHR